MASATDSVIGKDESEETGEESRCSRTVEIRREEENEVFRAEMGEVKFGLKNRSKHAALAVDDLRSMRASWKQYRGRSVSRLAIRQLNLKGREEVGTIFVYELMLRLDCMVRLVSMNRLLARQGRVKDRGKGRGGDDVVEVELNCRDLHSRSRKSKLVWSKVRSSDSASLVHFRDPREERAIARESVP